MKDRWGRTIKYVRLSLTEACNFACPYCREHKVEALNLEEQLNLEEWLCLIDAFASLGVEAIRLTGGEPLLYPSLEELIRAVKKKYPAMILAMTTNGSLLAEKAKALKAAGLDRVNISLDALEKESFQKATGGYGSLEKVLEGIEAAQQVGFTPIKLNTVLWRALTVEVLKTIEAFMEQWPVIWRFIECMPFAKGQSPSMTFKEFEELWETYLGEPLKEVQGVVGFGPATYFELPKGQRIGFIFPLSAPYCEDCNRLRVTADGKLRLCLLRDEEVDLKGLLKAGATKEALMETIKEALGYRKNAHETCITELERPMWRIGG